MNDDRWLDAAGEILDGRAVAWESLPHEPTAEDPISADEFQLIADVASAHRGLSATRAQWGPFELLDRIGHGTFGDVFRAADPALDRHVALKLFSHGRPATLGEEAKLLARVRHPNVVTVYGAAIHDGRYGIWMELVTGRTLAEIVHDRGPFPWRAVAHIGLDVCAALEAVHASGLLHGDVKAQNVMREDDGRIVLMDFGAGRFLSDSTARLAGTPLYLAPEVLDGRTPDARADIYSVAVLLHYLLTGTYPIEGRTLDDIRAAHAQRRRSTLGGRPIVCPRSLSTAIERGLATERSTRFADASAFGAALQAVLGPSRWLRRAALFTTAALLALAAGAFGAHVVVARRPAPMPFHARDWALVTTFDNRTGDPTLNHAIEDALEYQLSNSSYVNVVPPNRVEDTLRLMARPAGSVLTAALGRDIALRDGDIRAVIEGSIDRVGNAYAIVAQVVNPQDGAVVASDREEASTRDGIPLAVRRLSLWVRTAAGESAGAVQQDAGRIERVTTPSLEATRLFSDGLRAFNRARFPEAELLFQSAVNTDPNFASAHVWLGWARVNMKRGAAEYLPSIQRAMNLAGSASEHEREWIAGSFYVLNHHNDRALGQFEAMVRRYPDDFWALENLIDIYARLGRQQDLLDLMDRVANAEPNTFRVQAEAASSFLGIGGIDAARRFVTRATPLMPAADADTDVWTTQAKIWTLLFPAHDLWTRGRPRDAAAIVDAVSMRPELRVDRHFTMNLVGTMRLALGQVRDAEKTFSAIYDPDLRAVGLASVALARGDRSAMRAQLKNVNGNDFSAVSLLIRAGDLDHAGRLLAGITTATPNSQGAVWSADEIEQARGNRVRIDAALASGVPWARDYIGARTFLYSETLARAAAARGNRAAAIKVLEQTAPVGARAYRFSTQSGFFWMRNQKLLADLYREGGEIDKAQAIEADLLTRLAVADPDYPLLVELKERAK